MFSLEAYKALINSILREMDNNSIEIKKGSIRLHYSGRNMYGMTCLGIVMDRYDFDNWRVEIIDEISKKIKNSGDESTVNLFKKFKDSLKHPSRDSMGMSQIEYFTDIKIPNEYNDELQAVIDKFISEE